MSEKNGLTKRERWSLYLRYQIMVEAAMSYEKMHGASWAWSYIPLAKKYYSDDKEAMSRLFTRHSVFYNTEPQTGQLVNGVVASLEEQIALGNPNVSEDMPVSVKASLMGPLAGIGDSLVQGILIPTLLSIGMGLAAGGNPMGPIFYILAYGIIVTAITIFAFDRGYKFGINAIETIVGEAATRFTNALNIFGIVIVGGLSATTIAATTKIEIPQAGETQPLQQVLDGIFPNIIPLFFVLLSWYLISVRKMSATKVMIILLIIVSVAVPLGIL